LLGRALAPVETLIAGWRSLVDARSAANRLRELLPGGTPVSQMTELPPPLGELSVDKAAFVIRGRERPILKSVSFELAAGESLAILGPSASGKSTLARLLVGVWKPASGVVRLDGADVAIWPREQLGPHVGYLPQDVELFSGTVSENIARLGDVDSEQVIEAARRAHAHEAILHLPQGYDTPIGEAGAVLSGGQRQRIALARALYGKPRLVVLDEPNASLDAEGEEALMQTMKQLRHDGATVVVITHRPAIVVGMDKVLVLKEGSVEYFGSREEFLSKVTRLSRTAEPSGLAQPSRQQGEA
jgi:PrtD family type I secretion system ABC transporter